MAIQIPQGYARSVGMAAAARNANQQQALQRFFD